MSRSQWREYSREVIRETLAELPATVTPDEAKKAISAAYPFGERAMHPYKIWLSEVRNQIEQRFPEIRRARVKAEFEAEMERRRAAGIPSVVEMNFGDEK